MVETANSFTSIDELTHALQGVGYHAPRQLATSVFLAMKLQRPLLLEGEPGVGKTELAKALSKVLGRPMLRLQCYDGMEQREALYEWNHTAQLLHMRAAMGAPTFGAGASSLPPEGASAALGRPGGSGLPTAEEIEREVYQPRYLIRRPLLQALQAPAPGAVLLIDEVDRADEPFEAFPLEYLGEYQVTIPELGTIKAEAAPITILTSNRTRDLNDAVKRRCLYQWMDYPERERELAIVQSQVPEAGPALTEQITRFVSRLRSMPFANAFQRSPGIAESVEWAKALVALDTLTLDPEVVQDTAGILFKQREDVAALIPLIDDLLQPEPA
ncbi:MAG: MoxR family ATPase [Hydrogenophaga sp.]